MNKLTSAMLRSTRAKAIKPALQDLAKLYSHYHIEACTKMSRLLSPQHSIIKTRLEPGLKGLEIKSRTFFIDTTFSPPFTKF